MSSKKDSGYLKGGGESRYAQRYTAKRSRQGGTERPIPTPFEFGYFKGVSPKGRGMFNFEPLPFEKPVKEIQQKTLKPRVPRLIKYDHFRMNYSE